MFWLPNFDLQRLLQLGHHGLEQRGVAAERLVVVGAEHGAVGDRDRRRCAPWPAKTVNTLAPSAVIRSSTAFCAPLPSATMVMTAPTPMMMPSIVSTARSLLARID